MAIKTSFKQNVFLCIKMTRVENTPVYDDLSAIFAAVGKINNFQNGKVVSPKTTAPAVENLTFEKAHYIMHFLFCEIGTTPPQTVLCGKERQS